MKKLTFTGFITIIYAFLVITGYKTGNSNALFAITTVSITGVMMLASSFRLLGKVFTDKAGLILILYLVFAWLVLSFTSSNIYNFILARYSIFFPIIMYLFFSYENKSYSFLTKLFLVLWAIVSIRAIYYYSTELADARDIASGHFTDNIMAGGGYGFAIGSAILAIYLTEMILWKKIRKNIVNVAFIILLCLVVFYTRSTITIIALFFGLLSAFVLRAFSINSLKSLSLGQVFSLIILVSVMLIFFLAKESIGEYILDVTQGSKDIIAIRLREIGVLLTEGSDSHSYTGSDMNARIGLIVNSFKTFLKNPLFGVMIKYGADSHILSQAGVGSHSELFDAFGTYGLLNAIPYLGTFYYGIKRERLLQKDNIGFSYIITILLMMSFNPFLFSQVCLVLFFIMPMLTTMYNGKPAEDVLLPHNSVPVNPWEHINLKHNPEETKHVK